jgi:hypothetical protein
MLFLTHRNNFSFLIKNDTAGACGALIYGSDVVHRLFQFGLGFEVNGKSS